MQEGKRSARVVEAIRLHDIIDAGFDGPVGINTFNALLSVFSTCVLPRLVHCVCAAFSRDRRSDVRLPVFHRRARRGGVTPPMAAECLNLSSRARRAVTLCVGRTPQPRLMRAVRSMSLRAGAWMR